MHNGVKQVRKALADQPKKDRRIILVGPDQETLELLQSILPTYGFAVSIDADLSAVGDRGRFELVVFDEVEADIDGLDAFLKLGKSRAKDRFILLADSSDGDRVATALNSGMLEYISKPFEVEELAARINRAMDTADLLSSQDKNDEIIGFSGDLSYLTLSDILMNLHQNSRTGKLYATVEDGEYVYSFHRGALVKTIGPNGLASRKAFYRSMREIGGTFRFVALEKIRGSKNHSFDHLTNVILHAVQEADEFPLTRESLPEDPLLVSLSPTHEDIDLPESTAVQPLLEGLIQSTTIDILIHACPKTDLQAAQELEELMRKNILVENRLSETG